MTAVSPGVVLLLLVAAVVAVLMVLAALGRIDLTMDAPGSDREHRRSRRPRRSRRSDRPRGSRRAGASRRHEGDVNDGHRRRPHDDPETAEDGPGRASSHADPDPV